jgi:YD repeat-containing protein
MAFRLCGAFFFVGNGAALELMLQSNFKGDINMQSLRDLWAKTGPEKYTPPVRPTGYTYGRQGNVLSWRWTDGTGYDYTYDAQGRKLGYRETDGTGYDSTYDEQGREMSFRTTDGTGYDCNYDGQGHMLSFRRTDGTGYDVLAWHGGYSLQANSDGTFTAGCRRNLTRAQALAHWDRSDDRALLFTFAILFCCPAAKSAA